MTIEHRLIGEGQIHGAFNWTVFNSSQRLALPVSAEDVGKLCRQIGDGTFWALGGVFPTNWVQIGAPRPPRTVRNMTAFRQFGTVYTNNTAQDITLTVRANPNGPGAGLAGFLNSLFVTADVSPGGDLALMSYLTIPPGSNYRITAANVTLQMWIEIN